MTIVEPNHRKLGKVFYGFMKDDPIITDRHVKAAIELVNYFKAHANRVYAKLPGSKKISINQANADKGTNDDKNGVAQFLVRFLEDRGGYWDGMTSDLYDICKKNSVSDLPGGCVPFGKQIRTMAQDSNNGFILSKGYRGNHPIVKLSLPTLGNAGTSTTDSAEATESRSKVERVPAEHLKTSAHEDHLVEIKGAMEQLFEEHPEHKGELNPEVIAVELFWWNLLPFVPTEEEVHQALTIISK